MDTKMPDFSLRKWTSIVEAFYEKYHGLASWHNELMREVYKSGGIIRNPTGRIFKFKKFPTKSGLEYRRPQVVNYPVQSLATADIIPIVMVEMRKRMRGYPNAVMCNQVHDDIMYDCTPDMVPIVAQTMTQVFDELPILIQQRFGFEFNVPLAGEIKYGYENWKTLKEYKENT